MDSPLQGFKEGGLRISMIRQSSIKNLDPIEKKPVLRTSQSDLEFKKKKYTDMLEKTTNFNASKLETTITGAAPAVAAVPRPQSSTMTKEEPLEQKKKLERPFSSRLQRPPSAHTHSQVLSQMT
jgi:hypothetical protein